MIKNRTIGGAVYSGAHIISLPLSNPHQLPLGTLVGLADQSILPADANHPIVGILIHQTQHHLTLGVAGIFNALGQGTAGTLHEGGRGVILAQFQGISPDGQETDAIQILL